jgi:hypothetical protein
MAKIGEEITLKSMIDHGRTELAAAVLGQQDGHVMYMRGDKAVDQDKEPAKEPLTMNDLKAAAQEKAENDRGKEGPEQDRGMEM